ncbi:hypothetical protein BC629DRAFT_1443468 [Irpex lacteus]|nr:hypothetical protein BC629DRAFT_1443468 [Irpex lacteus]
MMETRATRLGTISYRGGQENVAYFVKKQQGNGNWRSLVYAATATWSTGALTGPKQPGVDPDIDYLSYYYYEPTEVTRILRPQGSQGQTGHRLWKMEAWPWGLNNIISRRKQCGSRTSHKTVSKLPRCITEEVVPTTHFQSVGARGTDSIRFPQMGIALIKT